MKGETKIDKYGRQLCLYDKSVLRLYGAWIYSGKIYVDKYAYRCDKCGMGFVGSGRETIIHQNGIEAFDKEQEAQQTLRAVKKFKKISLIGVEHPPHESGYSFCFKYITSTGTRSNATMSHDDKVSACT